MNNVYRYAENTEGNSRYIELVDGYYMERMTNAQIVEYFDSGTLYQLYMESPDGDIEAKPFENLGLFGAQPSPAMRFRKARFEIVAQ